MAIEIGNPPVAKPNLVAKVGVVAPVIVVPSNTETLLELALATARSGLVSPLKSAIATKAGLAPAAKSVFGEKVGELAPIEVVSRRIETELELPLATARSGLVSLLKSAIATCEDLCPS